MLRNRLRSLYQRLPLGRAVPRNTSGHHPTGTPTPPAGAPPNVTVAHGGGSIARNAAAMMVAQVMTWTATFLLILHLPRALGAETYGKLNFSLALMGLFASFVDFGTTTLVTREVARDRSRAEAYLTNVLVLKSVTAVLAYLGLLGSTVLIGRSPDIVHLVFIFGIGMMIDAIARLADSLLQAYEYVHYQAWGEVMDKVLHTALVLFLLAQGYGIVPIAWAMTAMNAVRLLRNGYWVLRLVRPRLHLLNLGFMRQAMLASLPFFLFAVFAKVYDKVDITMLGMMASDTVVGYYGAAYRLFTSLFFVPHILYTITFPVLSRLWAADQAAYRQAVRRSFAALSVAAVGVLVCTVVLAEPVVDLLYTRAEFPGTAPALRILALALACQYVNTAAVMVLQTTDRQTQWARAGALAALVNPAINYLLIPPLGHLGAAATTVITEAMLLVLAVRACPPGSLRLEDARALVRSLLAGGFLAGALLLGLRWGLAGALLLGLPVYTAAVIRLGAVSREDLALAKLTVRSHLRAVRKAA